jgi:hypothetical protein
MGKLRKGSSPFARTTANERRRDGGDKHQDRATRDVHRRGVTTNGRTRPAASKPGISQRVVAVAAMA